MCSSKLNSFIQHTPIHSTISNAESPRNIKHILSLQYHVWTRSVVDSAA
ncbi:tRNA (guanine(9)-N1)-methyltransferase [Dirofilaria immitis]